MSKGEAKEEQKNCSDVIPAASGQHVSCAYMQAAGLAYYVVHCLSWQGVGLSP